MMKEYLKLFTENKKIVALVLALAVTLAGGGEYVTQIQDILDQTEDILQETDKLLEETEADLAEVQADNAELVVDLASAEAGRLNAIKGRTETLAKLNKLKKEKGVVEEPMEIQKARWIEFYRGVYAGCFEVMKAQEGQQGAMKRCKPFVSKFIQNSAFEKTYPMIGGPMDVPEGGGPEVPSVKPAPKGQIQL
jgi:septal ring factor EnvC (AmiA/AmiB activator)